MWKPVLTIKDENQNLIWPIYSPLKASSRKPQHCPMLGGLELNVPGLGTQPWTQEMKVDVFLAPGTEFKMRAFSFTKLLAQPMPDDRGPEYSSAFPVLHTAVPCRWVSPSQYSQRNCWLHEVFPSSSLLFFSDVSFSSWNRVPSCSGKVLNVLNYNQDFQFLEMSQVQVEDVWWYANSAKGYHFLHD